MSKIVAQSSMAIKVYPHVSISSSICLWFFYRWIHKTFEGKVRAIFLFIAPDIMQKTIDAVKIWLRRKFPFLRLFSELIRKFSGGAKGSRIEPSNNVLPDWRSVKLPAEIGAAETMLLRAEQQLLYSLGRDYFTNEGCIVDAGCFLGGSTLALAYGVEANDKVGSGNDHHLINSYDLFVVEPWTIGIYFPQDTPLGTSFLPRFEDNIRLVSQLIKVNAGDVTIAELPDRPIEVLFIDLAKHWTVSDYLVREFFPRLIPGKSIVVQQDYLYHQWSGWLPVTMEVFCDYFEILDHTGDGSVAFLYHTKIPEELLQGNVFESLTRSEILDLSNQAIQRFDGRQKTILQKASDQLQGVLRDANWP